MFFPIVIELLHSHSVYTGASAIGYDFLDRFTDGHAMHDRFDSALLRIGFRPLSVRHDQNSFWTGAND